MHDITDLPAWERLFKKIVWKQLGDIGDCCVASRLDKNEQIFYI